MAGIAGAARRHKFSINNLYGLAYGYGKVAFRGVRRGPLGEYTSTDGKYTYAGEIGEAGPHGYGVFTRLSDLRTESAEFADGAFHGYSEVHWADETVRYFKFEKDELKLSAMVWANGHCEYKNKAVDNILSAKGPELFPKLVKRLRDTQGQSRPTLQTQETQGPQTHRIRKLGVQFAVILKVLKGSDPKLEDILALLELSDTGIETLEDPELKDILHTIRSLIRKTLEALEDPKHVKLFEPLKSSELVVLENFAAATQRAGVRPRYPRPETPPPPPRHSPHPTTSECACLGVRASVLMRVCL